MIKRYFKSKEYAYSRRLTWFAAACDAICAVVVYITGKIGLAVILSVTAIIIVAVNYFLVCQVIELEDKCDEFRRNHKMD